MVKYHLFIWPFSALFEFFTNPICPFTHTFKCIGASQSPEHMSGFSKEPTTLRSVVYDSTSVLIL